MNLLCPNCQKMLTVPEQFAGQLMKCPLCSGTFTVPVLPQPSAVPSGASDPAATFSPQTPPGPGDLYSVRKDAEPPPAPPPAPPPFKSEPPPGPGLHTPPPTDGVTTQPAPAPS